MNKNNRTKMNDQQFDDVIRAALKRNTAAAHPDDAAVARVLSRLKAAPLPPQKRAWWRLPAELLDWQFAPAWPRMAALAGCAVLGFTIGLAGLDQTLRPRRCRAAGAVAVRRFRWHRSGPVSVAGMAPSATRSGSSRWLLLGSLALNLFFVGVAISFLVRTPPQPTWDRNVFVRFERMAATLPPADVRFS